MVSESDEVPTLGLYVHFSGSKRKLEEYGKRVSATVGKLPSREYSRIDKIEDDVFYCIIRDISYELSAESFFDQNALRKNLAKLFREFTEAMLPGLESGRTIMDQK
jgi:hypothetical protein